MARHTLENILSANLAGILWRGLLSASEAKSLAGKGSRSTFSAQVHSMCVCTKQILVNSKAFLPKRALNADESETLAFLNSGHLLTF